MPFVVIGEITMASAKEIKGKIGSIKNTQKITKAMEMVAASKMKKAQAAMEAAVHMQKACVK